MKFLIASDFYVDFELVGCETKQQAIDYIVNTTTDNLKFLGTSDDFYQVDALEQADEVLFISDYLSDYE